MKFIIAFTLLVSIYRIHCFQDHHINFINQLIETHLSQCTTVLLLDRPHALVNVDKFISSELQWQKDVYITSIQTTKNAVENLKSVLDVHKWRPKCTQLIGMFKQGDVNEMEHAFTLAKLLRGIILKDHGYFIFLTRAQWTENLLRSSLGTKISKSIAVEESEPGTKKIVIKTLCVYCDAGKGRILTVTGGMIYPDLLQTFHGKKFRVSLATGNFQNQYLIFIAKPIDKIVS